METEWRYSIEEPARVVTEYRLGLKTRTVNFGAEETEGGWRYRSVTLRPGEWGYDAIVSALVRAEYPDDRMQAVVNNYLLDPGEAEAKAEMEAMQTWRATAKTLAQEALKEEG